MHRFDWEIIDILVGRISWVGVLWVSFSQALSSTRSMRLSSYFSSNAEWVYLKPDFHWSRNDSLLAMYRADQSRTSMGSSSRSGSKENEILWWWAARRTGLALFWYQKPYLIKTSPSEIESKWPFSIVLGGKKSVRSDSERLSVYLASAISLEWRSVRVSAWWDVRALCLDVLPDASNRLFSSRFATAKVIRLLFYFRVPISALTKKKFRYPTKGQPVEAEVNLLSDSTRPKYGHYRV